MSSQAHTASRSSFPVVVAIIGVFLLFWFLTSKMYVDKVEPVVAEPTERPSLVEFEGAAEKRLSHYTVTDAANGKVRLTIDRAKELVLAENAN